jgi:hypothetical protein
MIKNITISVVAMITLSVLATLTLPPYSKFVNEDVFSKAPPAITGENVYVAWWTNQTANSNEEVQFRATPDGGSSFGEKINLSNTTDADSTRVEIDSDADSVVVTWWETNQTHDTPVMRVSDDDNGATLGPLLTLATIGTLGEAAD